MDEQLLLEKYLLSIYHFLNFRLRSEKEIRDNLKEKKVPENIVEKIVEKLKEQKFLNDETFARLWIESRSRSKPRSQFVLKLELQKKGIAKDIIEKVLTNAETEVQSDSSLAKDLVERNIHKYRSLPKQEIYKKLGGVLARRGFNWEVTKKAIDSVLSSSED